MSERFATLEKEATNREVEAWRENQAAVLTVNDNSQQAGVSSPTVQVLSVRGGQQVFLPSPPKHTLLVVVDPLCNRVKVAVISIGYSCAYRAH